MIRIIIPIFVFVGFITLGADSLAKPVGLATVTGKVVSYDKKWIVAKINKKKVKIPRSVVRSKFIRIGDERDFYLSQGQLTYVKLQYFQNAKRKKKRQ